MRGTENISFFRRVTHVTPFETVSLIFVLGLIKSVTLKELTEKIRRGLAEKTLLPCVTFAGKFAKRCKEGLEAWSHLVAIDIDHLDWTPTLKARLSGDCFLRPVLIYTTPSGEGLRVVVRIKGGSAENYGLYYELISFYLKGAYGVEADPACKDITRLSFLVYDPEPFYFEDGFVTEEALLRLLPKFEESKTETPASVSAAFVEALNERRKYNKDRAYPVSTGGDPKPSDLLNRVPAVHEMAVAALRRHGWKQQNDRWTRPGKDGGTSAVYNFFDREGIYFMTNFSSNSPGFGRKGYTDVAILTELDYNGDFKKCIADLANKYLN